MKFRAKVDCGVFICLLLLSLLSIPLAVGQNTPADSFSIRTVNLPKALVNSHFQYQLLVRGGNQPYHWSLSGGNLPAGIKLTPNGSLEGTPTETGEFHFIVKAADSSQPFLEREQSLVLKVNAPLLARWERYPKVNGRRIEGSVKVSNDTDYDFDLTFIVLAVNEIGRAQALGYQRFTLRKNTTDFQLPFGENLPRGSYQIYADVVGEVAATNSIHRARLQTKAKLAVQLGP